MSQLTFKTTYPATTSLITLLSGVVTTGIANDTSALAAAEAETVELPELIDFLSKESTLGAEVTALKASPSDIESALEVIVTDLHFTSAKAAALIPLVFSFAESAVALGQELL